MVFDFKSVVNNMAEEEQEKAVEKNNAIDFQKFKTQNGTDTSGGQVIENNASGIEKIVDVPISGAVGVGNALTYLMDLPFYAGQVMNFAQGKTLEVAGKAFGFSEKDINEKAVKESIKTKTKAIVFFIRNIF